DRLDGLGRVRGFERRPSPQPAPAEPQAEAEDTAPESPVAIDAASFLKDLRPLATAAATDGALLVGSILALLLLTSAFGGAGIARVLDTAAISVGLLASLIVALYFFLLGGIYGATPGQRWAGMTPARPFRGTARDAWAT